MVFRDVGPALDLSRRMAVLAHFDALTGLPNRLLLNDRLTEAITLRRRQRTPLAVCMLDLDWFKGVNDSWGHAVGDRLLRSVADRLVGALRRSDTVSRYGGDEFVVLLSEMGQAAHAEPVAKKLLRALAQPHRVDGRDLRVSGSLGFALYPDDGQDAGTLIANADAALYDAKRHAKGGWRRFAGATGTPHWLDLESRAPAEPTGSGKASG
jgi:diguanylate cyclase (GGDEF)-like protein